MSLARVAGAARCSYCAKWSEGCIVVDTSDTEYHAHVICRACVLDVGPLDQAPKPGEQFHERQTHEGAPRGWSYDGAFW